MKNKKFSNISKSFLKGMIIGLFVLPLSLGLFFNVNPVKAEESLRDEIRSKVPDIREEARGIRACDVEGSREGCSDPAPSPQPEPSPSPQPQPSPSPQPEPSPSTQPSHQPSSNPSSSPGVGGNGDDDDDDDCTHCGDITIYIEQPEQPQVLGLSYTGS